MFECKDNDNYFTPKEAWENIKDFIPKNKIIWEAFYGDGKSGEYLEELGFEVIHKPVDFFTNDLGDIIVSNPPFSLCQKIISRMKVIQKPFIMILPCQKMCYQYFKSFGKDNKELQIIIPKKRINFNYEGKDESKRSSANFDCFYYCWKMNLENDITFL